MSQTLNVKSLISILKDGAAGLSGHSDEVRELDALIADGDMGVTAELASKGINEYLANPGEDDIGKLLMKCGMQINRVSPSTFGTLLAAAFMEAGKACLGRKEIEVKDFLLIGKGAVDGIKKRGKSDVGEKTMLDPLASAVEAFQQALAKGADPKAAIEAGIKGAEAGTEATIKMKATHGRAAYRQDKGVGVQDAGATAMYYLIEALGRSLISHMG